jgi:hypothetical protein
MIENINHHETTKKRKHEKNYPVLIFPITFTVPNWGIRNLANSKVLIVLLQFGALSVPIVAESHSHDYQQSAVYLIFKNNLWERHLAAIFEPLEPKRNPPESVADHWAPVRLWRVRCIFEIASIFF